ncbi:MAG: hypothetical protein ACI90V_009752, partial [Bacillariaceae sp.]|jgi:hypothetical protein
VRSKKQEEGEEEEKRMKIIRYVCWESFANMCVCVCVCVCVQQARDSLSTHTLYDILYGMDAMVVCHHK